MVSSVVYRVGRVNPIEKATDSSGRLETKNAYEQEPSITFSKAILTEVYRIFESFDITKICLSEISSLISSPTFYL